MRGIERVQETGVAEIRVHGEQGLAQVLWRLQVLEQASHEEIGRCERLFSRTVVATDSGGSRGVAVAVAVAVAPVAATVFVTVAPSIEATATPTTSTRQLIATECSIQRKTGRKFFLTLVGEDDDFTDAKDGREPRNDADHVRLQLTSLRVRNNRPRNRNRNVRGCLSGGGSISSSSGRGS
jgi:hypothetical protein